MKVIVNLEVFIARRVRSLEMQHMLIFILTFNLFFHLTSFGEIPFGRDSDLFISD